MPRRSNGQSRRSAPCVPQIAKAEHEAAAQVHDEMCNECAKAADGDLKKLVPTQVSAVVPTRPTITPVPRYGAPPLQVPDLDDEFVKVFGLDAESMHSEEQSLRQ